MSAGDLDLDVIMETISELDTVGDALALCDEAGVAAPPGAGVDDLRQILSSHYRGTRVSSSSARPQKQHRKHRTDVDAPPTRGTGRASTPPRRKPPPVVAAARSSNGSPPAVSPPRSHRSSGGRNPPVLAAKGTVPRSSARERYSPAQVTQMERTFSEAGGGLEAGSPKELSIEQVKDFFDSEGWEADDDWARQCFATYDTDGSGTISFDEFALLVEQLAPHRLKSSKSTADAALPAGTKRGQGAQLEDVWEDNIAKHSKQVKMPWTKKDFDELSPKKKKICVGGMCLWCLVLAGFVVNLIWIVLENANANCPTPEEEPDLLIPTNPVRPPITQCLDHVADKLSSDVVPAVDILIVTDQSKSMGPYNARLSANLDAFISSLNINSQDYTNHWQMIVANSDTGCNVGGIVNSNTKGLVSSYRTSLTANCPSGTTTSYNSLKCTGRFEAAISSWAGKPGDGRFPYTEATLMTAVLAAEKSAVGQCNAGFIRPEALLHVILISDATTPYEKLLPRLQAVKGSADLVQVSVFRNYMNQILPYDPNGILGASTQWGAAPTKSSSSASVQPGAGYKEAAAGIVNGNTVTSPGLDADIMADNWTHACYNFAHLPLVLGSLQAPHGQPADTQPNQKTNQRPVAENPAVCGQALNAGNSGGDKGYLQTSNAGGGGFQLKLAYNAYQRRDRFIVWKNTATDATLRAYGVSLALSPNPPHFLSTNNDAPGVLIDPATKVVDTLTQGTRRNATQVCEGNPDCFFDSGCVNNVNSLGRPKTSPWLNLGNAVTITLAVVPNCENEAAQRSGGTAWVMDIQGPPPPPPAAGTIANDLLGSPTLYPSSAGGWDDMPPKLHHRAGEGGQSLWTLCAATTCSKW
jgi:hypothetical protein